MKLEDVPEQIKLKWKSDIQKQDSTKHDCLFVTFETEAGLLLVQKYTATMFNMLADRISGRENELKESFFTYEHVDTPTFRGRAQFPGFIPRLKKQERRNETCKVLNLPSFPFLLLEFS